MDENKLIAGVVCLLLIVANIATYQIHRKTVSGKGEKDRVKFQISIITKLFRYVKIFLYLMMLLHIVLLGFIQIDLVFGAAVSMARITMGGILGFFAIILLYSSLRTLGKNFAPCDQGLVPEEKINTGIYRWLKHPIYVSNTLQLIAVSIMLPGIMIYIVSVILCIFYIFAIHDENKLLKEMDEKRAHARNI